MRDADKIALVSSKNNGGMLHSSDFNKVVGLSSDWLFSAIAHQARRGRLFSTMEQSEIKVILCLLRFSLLPFLRERDCTQLLNEAASIVRIICEGDHGVTHLEMCRFSGLSGLTDWIYQRQSSR